MLKIPLRDAGAISIGIEMVVSVVIGMLTGGWFDKRFHTMPAMTLVGIIMGSIAGFRSLLRFMKRSEARQAREDREQAIVDAANLANRVHSKPIDSDVDHSESAAK